MLAGKDFILERCQRGHDELLLHLMEGASDAVAIGAWNFTVSCFQGHLASHKDLMFSQSLTRHGREKKEMLIGIVACDMFSWDVVLPP